MMISLPTALTRILTAATTGALLTLTAATASAHYGMVIPSENMVSGNDGRSVDLEFSFAHPFEQLGLELGAHSAIVQTPARGQSALELTATTRLGSPASTASYRFREPGTHVFAMTMEPFWEPDEDIYIQHLPKTYVAAFGDDSGWNASVGLPVEITPLTRPFGLWSGNIFSGQVMRDGEAVPFAEVEVEYLNADGSAVAPDELMITQTIVADADGVFSYVTPVPGWWGFAALLESDETIPFSGVDKGVELGAVIWVKFEDWQTK